MTDKAEQMLTSEEVAAMLQIPQRTVDQWAYLGKGPRYFRVGRYRRYRSGDVVAWLNTRAV